MGANCSNPFEHGWYAAVRAINLYGVNPSEDDATKVEVIFDSERCSQVGGYVAGWDACYTAARAGRPITNPND